MSLRFAVFLCFLGGFLLLAVGYTLWVPRFAATLTLREVESTATTRTQSLAQDLGRTLYGEWAALGVLAGDVALRDPNEARAYFDGVASSVRVSWVGFAGVDGTVQVASDGLLEGQNVSTRPWFQAGLESGYVGGGNEAELLGALLAPDAQEPLRFVVMALPVNDATGRRIGVIGMHLDEAWLRRYLVEAATIRQMDVFLVTSDGSVSVTSLAQGAQTQEIGALRAAAVGAPVALLETWPDGRNYVSAVIPEIRYQSLPNFGWRIVGRVPMDGASIPTVELIRNSSALALATATLFAFAAMVFVWVFVRPITRLIDVADRVSRGEKVYPPHLNSTHDASKLAGAIARWQSTNLKSDDDP